MRAPCDVLGLFVLRDQGLRRTTSASPPVGHGAGRASGASGGRRGWGGSDHGAGAGPPPDRGVQFHRRGGTGGTIDFHVSVDPPQEFGVDVHRVGHYDGRRTARIASGPRLAGIAQPPPLTADRTVSCHHWWLSWRLRVPSDWSVGAYVAVLTTADGRHRSHIPFTVRDDRPADLLLVLPDITWQAHNRYPWDEDGQPLDEADAAATTVSFDRPYADTGLPPYAGHTYDVIRWAEHYGYDLAYADAGDLHACRVDPTRYRGWSSRTRRVLVPGHA
ncbi:N,N-dimethylformamidase beta subunit family domain-containing protein [Streptomyces sp. INA 01156]